MPFGNKQYHLHGASFGFESVLLGIATNLGGFLFGYDTGQISGMLIFTDFNQRFSQYPDRPPAEQWNSMYKGLMVSLMSIGSLFGALTASYTLDRLGRRWSLMLGVFIFIIGNIIQISAMYSWVHMMAGRLVAGVGIGNLSVGVPMFQSECLPRQIRGPIVASYQLMITIGILISNLINVGVRNIQGQSASWRIVIGLGIFFSLPLGAGIFFSPESPRWLAGQDRWDDARAAICRLRGVKNDTSDPTVEEDMQEMSEAIVAQSHAGVGTWAELFTGKPSRIPRLVHRTFLGMGIHAVQQFTGVNYFFYYGATVFSAAGVKDPLTTQLIMGAVNVAMTFPGLYIVERLGRRRPLIFGALWQAAWLLVFAVVGTKLPPTENPVAGKIMIVSACMFIASFAMTWGPFAWVIIGESFPLRTRSKQMSLSTSTNWLSNWLLGFITPIANSSIAYKFGFVFFAVNFAGAALIYFMAYETKGLSLESVDLMYSQPDVKAPGSRKWVPPGYHTRERRDSAYFQHKDSAADIIRRGSVGDSGGATKVPEKMRTASNQSWHEYHERV